VDVRSHCLRSLRYKRKAASTVDCRRRVWLFWRFTVFDQKACGKNKFFLHCICFFYAVTDLNSDICLSDFDVFHTLESTRRFSCASPRESILWHMKNLFIR